MGYTHYWKVKNGAALKDLQFGKEKFADSVALFKSILESLNGKVKTDKGEIAMELKGGNGYGEPTITDTLVVFNGTAENDLGHETFFLSLDEPCAFAFCKTARKPYDTAVCLALLCFKHYFGEDFIVTSDGDMDGKDWEIPNKIFADFVNS